MRRHDRIFVRKSRWTPFGLAVKIGDWHRCTVVQALSEAIEEIATEIAADAAGL